MMVIEAQKEFRFSSVTEPDWSKIEVSAIGPSTCLCDPEPTPRPPQLLTPGDQETHS